MACENQYDAVMKRIRTERDTFEKSLEKKKSEFIASQTIMRNQLEARVCKEMEEMCDGYFETFEQASSELSLRHQQIEGLVLHMHKIKSDFASWKNEKQHLTEKVANALQSQEECMLLLEKTEKDLGHSQKQCNEISANNDKLISSKEELELEKTAIESRLEDMERQLANKAAEIEAVEIAHQMELDRAKATRSTLIDEQTRKLRDLMKTMTLQEDKLKKRHKFIEEKEEELALREQNIHEESVRNEKLLQHVQDERDSLKELQREMDDQLEQQELKELELAHTEERLNETEQKLNKKQEDIKAGQHRIKELAVQLQKRNEEVSTQRQLLQERLQKCDDYETQLSAWEKQLDEMATIMGAKEDESDS